MLKKKEGQTLTDLGDKGMERFWNFVVETMVLTEDENAAVCHQIPMTQEIYDSILDKCDERGHELEGLLDRMMVEYPDFLMNRVDRMLAEVKKEEIPGMSEEESEACRKKIFDEIRAIEERKSKL